MPPITQLLSPSPSLPSSALSTPSPSLPSSPHTSPTPDCTDTPSAGATICTLHNSPPTRSPPTPLSLSSSPYLRLLPHLSPSLHLCLASPQSTPLHPTASRA